MHNMSLRLLFGWRVTWLRMLSRAVSGCVATTSVMSAFDVLPESNWVLEDLAFRSLFEPRPTPNGFSHHIVA